MQQIKTQQSEGLLSLFSDLVGSLVSELGVRRQADVMFAKTASEPISIWSKLSVVVLFPFCDGSPILSH